MARGRFAKSHKQAASVMKELQGIHLESIGTVRNYEAQLKICCDYLKEFRLGALRDLTPELAKNYLSLRATECSQSTLDLDRLAIQTMMQHVTKQLSPTETLYPRKKTIQSEIETIAKTRSYTPGQLGRITSHQRSVASLSTRLCAYSGLRAHELLSLRPRSEVKPSDRVAHSAKFSYLPYDFEVYVVNGKGGLLREVAIPVSLAEELECYRLNTPETIVDRNVRYESYYGIPGGHRFSDAFSKASLRGLGFTNGAHGLRHTYAQDRYEQLANHFDREIVLLIISQELGHFRPSITEVYLR